MSLKTNDYTLNIIFGRKGSGKSSTLACLARKGARKHQTVYCSEHIKGTLYFDIKDLGKFDFKPDSLVLIDEINNEWDNRNFKNFSKDTQKFFRYQRHFRLTVYCFSQTYDCDLKIKNLCDRLFICKKLFGFLSVLKTVDKYITITKATDYGGSVITDEMAIRPFYLPGARSFIFLPAYRKMFDSFEKYPLPSYETFYDLE